MPGRRCAGRNEPAHGTSCDIIPAGDSCPPSSFRPPRSRSPLPACGRIDLSHASGAGEEVDLEAVAYDVTAVHACRVSPSACPAALGRRSDSPRRGGEAEAGAAAVRSPWRGPRRSRGPRRWPRLLSNYFELDASIDSPGFGGSPSAMGQRCRSARSQPCFSTPRPASTSTTAAARRCVKSTL